MKNKAAATALFLLIGLAWGSLYSATVVSDTRVQLHQDDTLLAEVSLSPVSVSVFSLFDSPVSINLNPKMRAEVPVPSELKQHLLPEVVFSRAVIVDDSNSEFILATALVDGHEGYYVPYVFANSTMDVVLHCEAVLQIESRSFSCWNQLHSRTHTFLNLDDSMNSRYIEVSVEGVPNDALLAKLLALAAMRVFERNSLVAKVSEASEILQSRQSSLRLFATFVYAGVLLEMVFLAAIVYRFVTRIPFISKSRLLKVTTLFYIIAGIVSNLYIAGIAGLFAVQGVLLLSSLTLPVIRAAIPYIVRVSTNDEDGDEVDKSMKKIVKRVRHFYLGLVSSIAFVVALIVLYPVKSYFIWDRSSSSFTGEFQPHLITKSIAVIYSYEDFAMNFNVNWFFQLNTDVCSSKFKQPLISDEEKESEIFQHFIERYSINMTEYLREDYRSYSSVNDWFIRGLKPGVRPIAFENDPMVVVSPADSRIVGFNNFEAGRQFWLKGDAFDVETLLQGSSETRSFLGGSLLISRLSPQDYHRYHSPVSGIVIEQFFIEGDYHAVNADAVTSGNEVLVRNARMVVVLQTTTGHKVAFVPVGANCVGSIVSEVVVGEHVKKGQELGYFQFGGSTVVLLFEPDAIEFDDDIMLNSRFSVETFVRMGQTIGRLI